MKKQRPINQRWINTRVTFEWDGEKYAETHNEGYWYDGALALATTPPTMEVTDWAFYNDGTEPGSVIIGTKNVNQTLNVDTIYFARFGLEETSGNSSKNTAPQLQYNHNGGGWNNVTGASSVVQSIATANIADGDDTTQRLTAFTYDPTNEGFDEVDGIAGGGTADLSSTGFEALYSFQILSADVVNNDTIVLKIVDSNNADADYDIYNQTDPTITVSEAAPPDDLLADDVQSISEVTNPVIIQSHVLLADDVQSLSDNTNPVIAQDHILNADNAQSLSEASNPTASESHVLLADNTESLSETTNPAITQSHVFTVISTESSTELTTPVITQVYNITVVSVESASELSNPILTQSNVLSADNVESSSESTNPTLSESNILLADDVESASELIAPIFNQSHVFASVNAESGSELNSPNLIQSHNLLNIVAQSNSELSNPVLSESGADELLADNVQSLSNLTSPPFAQAHIITADNTESLSELSNPILSEIGEDVLLADNVESASQTSSPILAQINALLSNGADSVSELTNPILSEALAPDDIQSLSNLINPVIGQIHVLLSNNVEAASELSAPVLGSDVIIEVAKQRIYKLRETQRIYEVSVMDRIYEIRATQRIYVARRSDVGDVILKASRDKDGITHWPDVIVSSDLYYGIDWSLWLSNENDTFVSMVWDALPSGLSSSDDSDAQDISIIKIKSEVSGEYIISGRMTSEESGVEQVVAVEMHLRVMTGFTI